MPIIVKSIVGGLITQPAVLRLLIERTKVPMLLFCDEKANWKGGFSCLLLREELL